MLTGNKAEETFMWLILSLIWWPARETLMWIIVSLNWNSRIFHFLLPCQFWQPCQYVTGLSKVFWVVVGHYVFYCFSTFKIKQFKIEIIDIFNIFNDQRILNRMDSSPQSFLVFQLAMARTEALGTRLRPWNTWYWYSWVIVDRCGPLWGRCGSFRVFRGFSNCGRQLRRLIMTK